MKQRKNQKGQGTTEYIVILAIIVGLALVLIKTNLYQYLQQGVQNVGQSVTTATTPPGGGGGGQ